jgi:integrase
MRFIALAAIAAVTVFGTAMATTKDPGAPRRPFPDDDPKGFMKKSRPFKRGPLPGWYIFVYTKQSRIVCKSPTVWDGPMVIECADIGELIFHRQSKGRSSQPVKAFDKAWRNALAAAKLPKERLFHDLRRSAARNLRRAGASETEAMKVTGHKTPSMFRRYSIVTDDEAASALLKVDAMLGKRRK